MSSIRLNLLTKTTWKLKTPGGILVFRVLVQVRGAQAGAHCAHGDGGTQGLVLRIIDVENAHNAMARAAVLEE